MSSLAVYMDTANMTSLCQSMGTGEHANQTSSVPGTYPQRQCPGPTLAIVR